MNSNGTWIDGYQTPIGHKMAMLLLVVVGCGMFIFIGYKIEVYGLFIVGVVLAFLLIGWAFFRTWLSLDSENKVIYVRKRFYWNRISSYSYKTSCLQKQISSLGPSSSSYGATGISTELYLKDNRTGKKSLIFSSSVYEDKKRVIDYLNQYVDKCKC